VELPWAVCVRGGKRQDTGSKVEIEDSPLAGGLLIALTSPRGALLLDCAMS